MVSVVYTDLICVDVLNYTSWMENDKLDQIHPEVEKVQNKFRLEMKMRVPVINNDLILILCH